MLKKLALITISSLLLGGCTLLDSLRQSDAAQDVKPAIVATPTPLPSSDSALQAMPSTAPGTDVTSLETDINSTVILDEDFSDLD